MKGIRLNDFDYDELCDADARIALIVVVGGYEHIVRPDKVKYLKSNLVMYEDEGDDVFVLVSTAEEICKFVELAAKVREGGR